MIGKFVNINNRQFKLEIDTGGNEEITFSGNPCIIEYTGEDENLFKPIKYSSATFEYVSEEVYQDLFSATPLQNPVRLYDDRNDIIWQGYVTPNVYNNPFDFTIDTKTIECIDGLAVLEYIDYTTIGGGAKKVVKILDIIKHCLNKTELTYNNLLISDNVKIDNTQWETLDFIVPNKSYLDICYISECNFFDEDGVPMKCKEVLEEICKYFNLTMYAYGQKIYMIDYCAIKSEYHLHWNYDLINDTCNPVLLFINYELSDDLDLIGESSISINNTYNKVSVEADVYPYEKMMPDMFDDIEQIGNLYYDYIEDKEGYMFYMFVKNPNYQSYYYNKDTYSRVYPSTIDYDTIQNYFGATLVKHSFETYGDPGIVNTVNWGDYLLIHLHQAGNASYDKLKIFETNVSDLDERILANFNNYLVIDGTATYYDIEDYTAKVEHSRKDDDYADSKVVIPCSLCYGGSSWYNGTDWQSTECTFDLPFYSVTNRDHYLGKDFNVRNNIIWYDGLESTKGRKILLDTGMSNLANLKFTMYAPTTPNSDYRLDYIFIKDFSIKVETSKNSYSWDGSNIYDFIYADELNNTNTNETNIVYENVINEDYTEEMETITNKIHTFAKEQVANSNIAFSINNSTDNLFYAKTVQIESLDNQKMREEEYTVYRMVEQYKEPTLRLEVKLWKHYPLYSLITNSIIDPNKKFVIDSMIRDYRLNETIYNLIEKK